MSNMTNDEIKERAYELGFDDGYNEALLNINKRLKDYVDIITKNKITEEN